MMVVFSWELLGQRLAPTLLSVYESEAIKICLRPATGENAIN